MKKGIKGQWVVKNGNYYVIIYSISFVFTDPKIDDLE